MDLLKSLDYLEYAARQGVETYTYEGGGRGFYPVALLSRISAEPVGAGVLTS